MGDISPFLCISCTEYPNVDYGSDYDAEMVKMESREKSLDLPGNSYIRLRSSFQLSMDGI